MPSRGRTTRRCGSVRSPSGTPWAYDAVCLGDGTPPTERLAAIRQPVLMATGGTADDTMTGLGNGFFDTAAAAIPGAERAVIPNQGHVADPEAVVPVITRFFNGKDSNELG